MMIIQNKDAVDYTNFIYPEFDTFENYTNFLEYLNGSDPLLDYSSIAYHMLRYLEVIGHCETVEEILENV